MCACGCFHERSEASFAVASQRQGPEYSVPCRGTEEAPGGGQSSSSRRAQIDEAMGCSWICEQYVRSSEDWVKTGCWCGCECALEASGNDQNHTIALFAKSPLVGAAWKYLRLLAVVARVSSLPEDAAFSGPLQQLGFHEGGTDRRRHLRVFEYHQFGMKVW